MGMGTQYNSYKNKIETMKNPLNICLLVHTLLALTKVSSVTIGLQNGKCQNKAKEYEKNPLLELVDEGQLDDFYYYMVNCKEKNKNIFDRDQYLESMLVTCKEDQTMVFSRGEEVVEIECTETPFSTPIYAILSYSCEAALALASLLYTLKIFALRQDIYQKHYRSRAGQKRTLPESKMTAEENGNTPNKTIVVEY